MKDFAGNERAREAACPGCGVRVERAWVACPECGRDLMRQDADPRPGQPCPDCGKPTKRKWVRCPECGANLASPETESPEQVPDAPGKARLVCPACGKRTTPRDGVLLEPLEVFAHRECLPTVCGTSVSLKSCRSELRDEAFLSDTWDHCELPWKRTCGACDAIVAPRSGLLCVSCRSLVHADCMRKKPKSPILLCPICDEALWFIVQGDDVGKDLLRFLQCDPACCGCSEAINETTRMCPHCGKLLHHDCLRKGRQIEKQGLLSGYDRWEWLCPGCEKRVS